MKAVFAAILTLVATSAFAGTWYVAPPANGGSDSNPGTLSAPFATIAHGVSVLSAAGDVLNVRAGTYNESITVWQKYGTSASPIRIQNYSGETPVIDGTGSGATGSMVVIDECSYVNFDGFEVKNGPATGILVYDSDHVKVRWNSVHDMQEFGIHAGSTTVGQSHDLLFDGNDVKRCVLQNSNRTSTSCQQAIGTYMTDHVTFTNNYVHSNFGEGIDFVVGDYATFSNNTACDNYSTNIYIDNGRHVTVDSNYMPTGCSGSASLYYRNGTAAGGISVANEYYDTQKPSTDLLIINNITAWCGNGFAYGNWEYGGGLHATTVANNTFYHSTYDSILVQDNGTNQTDTTTIENNIIDAYSTSYSAEAPSAGITWRNNDWYGGVSGHTFPGAGDITSDPQLVNPSNGGSAADYKLQSTSPCINAGYSETSVTHDYWGTARTSGSYDIGAHEY